MSKSFHILCVEDNPADLRLITQLMKRANSRALLSSAKDGAEALDFIFQRGNFDKSERPDLILLDLNLPRRNGFEVLKEIKKDDSTKAIPVIVFTTSNQEMDIRESYNLHAASFLTKPTDLNEFTELVQTFNDYWLDMAKLPSHPSSEGSSRQSL